MPKGWEVHVDRGCVSVREVYNWVGVSQRELNVREVYKWVGISQRELDVRKVCGVVCECKLRGACQRRVDALRAVCGTDSEYTSKQCLNYNITPGT
jgi:hypothetical protein